MSNRALVIGINNFVQPSWRLRGCINDTFELAGLLKTYYGFGDEEIKILHDSDATSQGIRESLGWLLSEYDGDGSDVRVLHFSSHGTQVDDQSDDELEAVDEVIVPYDHDWGEPFLDDELRGIFGAIPERVNFTFIADCCHSGSIQRVPLGRDQELEFEPRYLNPPPEVTKRIAEGRNKRGAAFDSASAAELLALLEGVPEAQRAEKVEEYFAQARSRLAENKYGFVSVDQHALLAACQDRQTAADARIEGDFRGAFTWGLSQAIKQSNGELTYGDLIARAGENISSYEQIPQLECPPHMRDLKVFSPLA